MSKTFKDIHYRNAIMFCMWETLAIFNNLRSYLWECAVPVLAPPSALPSIFTSKHVAIIMAAYWPISALSVSEKLVYRFCSLALCCLACFFNTHFTIPFALRVASAPTPVSLRLGNGEFGLKYWRIPVLILKKKAQLLKNNGTCSVTFTVVILHKAHYCCFSWSS